MQAAFLISTKSYTEKQVGLLFFVFGISQFLCMAPVGYFLDYSQNKIKWVIWSGCATSALTVITALAAMPFAENLGLMIILRMLQGGISAILTPGFNGITLGIVGSTGFTHQVSRNRMMNHIGTALIVAIGSLVAFYLYPHIGQLFIVSPLAAIGMYYNLRRIKPNHVNRDASRGLIISSPTMTEYEQMDDEHDVIMIASGQQAGENESIDELAPCGSSTNKYTPPDVLSHERQPTIDETKELHISRNESTASSEDEAVREPYEPTRKNTDFSAQSNPKTYVSFPSFNFGWGAKRQSDKEEVKPLKAQTPLSVFMDPSLTIFSLVVFFFHLANSSVLPLVMQNISLEDPQAGILLSGLCILIAQTFMSFFAKICGDYSPIWGRKTLTLFGLFSLTIRCFLLTFLASVQDEIEDKSSSYAIKALILSTQLLDSVGAGIFGTLYILVTNDISGGTGRFSLMLGITTGAMCLGGTVSGYIGQALAQDYGYPAAFSALGMISLVPFFTYALFMPETLPDYARPKPKQRRKRLQALLLRLNAQRKNLTARITRRSRPENKGPLTEQPPVLVESSEVELV
jgi:MFS family permease